MKVKTRKKKDRRRFMQASEHPVGFRYSAIEINYGPPPLEFIGTDLACGVDGSTVVAHRPGDPSRCLCIACMQHRILFCGRITPADLVDGIFMAAEARVQNRYGWERPPTPANAFEESPGRADEQLAEILRKARRHL